MITPYTGTRSLPPHGIDAETLKRRLSDLQKKDWDHLSGRLPLHYYYAGEDVRRVALDAAVQFASANALAPEAFPSCATMERDVVSMVLGLLNGGARSAGSITSGGTESIILAVKASRDRMAARRSLVRPNIVIPGSAHPAFDKAAHLLGMEVKRIPTGKDYRCDVGPMEAAIDEQTVLVAGSAPSLPFGLIDHIGALSELALRKGIWLHVDACIGGMLVPFVREIGYDVPPCDFALEGVTSMSCDLHKFGYASKGASLVLYRESDDHAFQFSRFSAWPKGEYVTPTLAGTRSGGPIASAWAVMHFLGHEGYRNVTRSLMQLRDRFLSRFESYPAIEVIGRPELSVLSVTSSTLDIFDVADGMRERGWYMSLVAQPNAIQQTVNLIHEQTFDLYFSDLDEVLTDVTQAEAPMQIDRPLRRVVTY